MARYLRKMSPTGSFAGWAKGSLGEVYALIGRLLLGSCLLGLAELAQAQTVPADQSAYDKLLSACAQSVACQSHLDKANQLYAQDRYSMAIEEYQAVYTLQPYPPILYNIARLYHKENHLPEAISYYQRYLDSAHSGQLVRARQLLAEAQRELASHGASQGAKDQPAPTGDPMAPPLASSAPAVLAPAVLAPALVSRAPLAPPERRASLPIYKQWWFWSVLGGTVVGAATAIGIGVYASGPDVSGLPAQKVSVGH